MSGNTKPKKPISRPTPNLKKEFLSREGEWGPVQYTSYDVGKHTFEQQEITWAQSEQITSLLLSAGVVDILAFNDIAGRTNAQGFRAALTKAGKTAEFLQIVLTIDGGAQIADGFFRDWPTDVMNQLVDEVIADFFTMSPSALNGLRQLSMPELALKAAGGLTGNSSTSPAMATFPGSL